LKSVLRRALPQQLKDSISSYKLLRRIRAGHRALDERGRSSTPPWDFKVCSQNGEDGIISHLVSELRIQGSTFVEFGFAPSESNLLCYAVITGAKGLFIDGSAECCSNANRLFPRVGINAKAVCAWIDRDNINELISANVGNDVGLLSVDLDGNDYWIWQSITAINPVLVITEYNASFGAFRSVSTPYARDFDRFQHHPSGACHGMSLRAATVLAATKGYSLICTDAAGLNAFFVRNEKLTPTLRPTSAERAFHSNRYRSANNTSQAQQEKIAFLGAVVEISEPPEY
jgi:hypothetical protein